MHINFLRGYILFFLLQPLSFAQSPTIDSTLFFSNQILSRPTDKSVTVIIVPKNILQIYYEYGTASFTYIGQSETVTSSPNVPVKIVLYNLQPNTRYFYRLRYKEISASQFIAGSEYTFMTQRIKGSTFKFGIQADSHLYDKKGIPVMMNITMQNIQNEKPDFVLDLGDTFGDDHQPTTITQQELMQLHLNFLPYIGQVCHSSHFFFCLGNHEGESGYYLLQSPPDNIAIFSTLARKYYYSNPVPDSFYTGNDYFENFGIGYPENYYAWEWGDALFVVLDVYRYPIASDSPGLWDWTLGDKQYSWFKKTLETSTAKYKFVFAHHVRGYGRGALSQASYFEWGGYENNGTTWGFSANRPSWAMPIHQLMVANGVNVFFQGHDHLFAQEILDGLFYQEVPMPSDSTYMIGMLANGDAYTSNQLNGTGHLLVTVDPDSATVEYVSSYLPRDTNSTHVNGKVAFSYSLTHRSTSVNSENLLPSTIHLEQNYPNPFNPDTKIKYTLTTQGHVTLKIFDILGREAAILVDENKQPGSYISAFSIPNNGFRFTSGVYFYQLKVNSTIITKKAVLIK